MNQRLSSTQPFDKAIASFVFFKSAEGLAQSTIYLYQKTLEHWGEIDISTWKTRSQQV
jgi:hypothetical protein